MSTYIEQAKELLNEDYVSTKYKNTFYLNGKSGAVEIQVRTDEGDYIPHFHLKILNNNIKECIMIAEARYFNHQPGMKLVFNSSEAKEFDSWMNRINPETGLTNFKTIVKIWNGGKGNNVKLDSDIVKPNYSLLHN